MFKIKPNTTFRFGVISLLIIYFGCGILNIIKLGGLRAALNNDYKASIVNISGSKVDGGSHPGKNNVRVIERSVVNNNSFICRPIKLALLLIFAGIAILAQKADILSLPVACSFRRPHTFIVLCCIRI